MLGIPASAAFRRARASMSSVISRPYALPVGPTRRADKITSMPPPDPRSSTTCPVSSCASAVGLPQPSDANTAASGNSSVSPFTYRFDVIGSTDPLNSVPPQQELVGPQPGADSLMSSTRRAAAPYFSRTISVMSAGAEDVRGVMPIGAVIWSASGEGHSPPRAARPTCARYRGLRLGRQVPACSTTIARPSGRSRGPPP